MTHNLLELLTRVAAGAELEGLSCTGGGGWGGRLCLLGSPAVSAPRGGGSAALILTFTHCLPIGWTSLIKMAFKSEKKKRFFPYSKSRDEIKLRHGDITQDQGSRVAAVWGVYVPVKAHLSLRLPTSELGEIQKLLLLLW